MNLSIIIMFPCGTCINLLRGKSIKTFRSNISNALIHPYESVGKLRQIQNI